VLCKYLHSVAHIEDEIRCQDIPQADATVDAECFIHAHTVIVCVRARARVCVRACARARVRARVCVCVRVCVCARARARLIKCVYLKGSRRIIFQMTKYLICYRHQGINDTTHVFNCESNQQDANVRVNLFFLNLMFMGPRIVMIF
jgi:hypothetical protein